MSRFELSPRTIGVMQILLAGICFGFLGIFGKGAFAKGLTPGEVLSLRFALSGVILFTYFGLRSRERLNLGTHGIAWSIVLGVLGYALVSYCYFQALTGLSASLTVLLLYMFPIFVPVGAHFFLGERIPPERRFILPLAMLGLVMLIWGDFYVKNWFSLALGISSALLYSAFILCSRRFLDKTDSMVSSAYMQLAAGFVIGLFSWRDLSRLSTVISAAWPWILSLALVCTIAAMSLFLAGLKRLKSWEVSVLSTSEPFTAIFLAFLILGERLTPLQSLGAAVVLVSLLAASIPHRTKKLN